MPQVMIGESQKKDTATWRCGDCADAGQEFGDEEAQVILHSVMKHGAYTVSRDTAKKTVRVQSKKA